MKIRSIITKRDKYIDKDISIIKDDVKGTTTLFLTNNFTITMQLRELKRILK